MKDDMTVWERAEVAAKLSAIAYMNPKPADTACKKLGFGSGKIISRDGAEVLVAKDRNDLWFAFRGTEPNRLNDVMADLKVIKNSAAEVVVMLGAGDIGIAVNEVTNELLKHQVNEG